MDQLEFTMKQLTTLLTCLFLLSACRETPKPATEAADSSAENEMAIEEGTPFPTELKRILDAHGGLALWRTQRTLSFELGDEEGRERHTVDLWSRKDRVETESYSLGFDGNGTWLLDPEKQYEGNAEFYHNLMFYFYAMPFVLADDGIRYSQAEDLVFEGKHYPGLRISYGEEVGASPDDEYVIHYDPDTGQMAWLGYTVTYFSGEPSGDFRWIRYDDWNRVGGLLLPASITWYTYQGRQPLEVRSTVRFERGSAAEVAMPGDFYKKPEGIPYWEAEQ